MDRFKLKSRVPSRVQELVVIPNNIKEVVCGFLYTN